MDKQIEDKKGEIVLYQPDSSVRIEVLLKGETIWLNRQQISELFGRDVKTIGKHINNALREELSGLPTVAKFATVQTEGGRKIVREIEYYDLDMILSIGYRVKSQRGIQFRKWSNTILKEYILKGYAVNDRIERIEGRLTETEKKIDFFIRTSLPPAQGVFFEGQIFEAYAFAARVIRSAKGSIVLLDNYIDESVLILLSKRGPGVSAEIYTRHVSPQLRLDIERHNAQFEPVNVKISEAFHDRFLIIDHTVYYIGSSLKDLGKKLFAFSKMDLEDTDILEKL